ncbi:hypothetical protein JCM17846_17250 [Iodidimonas nitroreducens]|uniref:SprA-related family protein n=1 Tax=Iodidimonas nitroreducens TaxID=1236968 RepID=A0A5A7N6T2_9PROT|nr:putative metalloprotease CJM1_0395 family protein [Iodidimonas nitroreducens]GAK34472.1 sprA-related family protein [alpha proteobacterium Q-1]GER04043.1 hypothetical protein JCM17846_17250 [Iodidimonas nitroreducens]
MIINAASAIPVAAFAPAAIVAAGGDAAQTGASTATQQQNAANNPRAFNPANQTSLIAGPTAIVAQQISPPSAAPEEAPDAQATEPDTAAVRLPTQLSDEERAVVNDLRARDREVRAHEAAHATAGAGIAGQPQFEFTTGPDGRQYAIAGEVAIDTSPVAGDPEATAEKMEQVIRAALAPAEPSPQDRAVAAQARAQLQIARAEAAALERAELRNENPASGEAITANAPGAIASGTPAPGLSLSLIA